MPTHLHGDRLHRHRARPAAENRNAAARIASISNHGGEGISRISYGELTVFEPTLDNMHDNAAAGAGPCRTCRRPGRWTRDPVPFPDANLLLLHGRAAALVDSGFVGHADGHRDWVRATPGSIELVVNTHWHPTTSA